VAWKKSTSIAFITAALATTALGQPAQRVTGPVATYWMSVQTITGMGGMMAGAAGPTGRGGIPNISAMMNGAGQAQHQLTLQLGSSTKPTGEPTAEHNPAAGLGSDPVLPLLTPKTAPPVQGEAGPVMPREMQRPNGKMLIFWGCGEHAPAGQPIVIDFAQIQSNPQAMASAFSKGLTITPMQPPSPSRNATYGEWPNEKTRTPVPPTGSLVGPHAVKGNYNPDINFVLTPAQDFMGALNLTTNAKNPSGSVQLAWNSLPTAQAYFASAFGGNGNTVVMWTSSQQQITGFAAPDYISQGDIGRLVAAQALMSPQTTSCTVPKEVVDASPQGFLQLVAYGQEANFSYPPRPTNPATPWNIQWQTKVRYRSVTSGLLGMDMAEMMGGRGAPAGRGRGAPGAPGTAPPEQAPPPASQPRGQRPNAGDILRGLGLPGVGR
jgi:hypothetical protein